LFSFNESCIDQEEIKEPCKVTATVNYLQKSLCLLTPTRKAILGEFSSSLLPNYYPVELEPISCHLSHPCMTCTGRQFHFEAFWPKLEGFHEAVEQAWQSVQPGACPLRSLHLKFRAVAKGLQAWSDKKVGHVESQLALAREVLHQLEIAQDGRVLIHEETALKNMLKKQTLVLASLNLSSEPLLGLGQGLAGLRRVTTTQFFFIFTLGTAKEIILLPSWWLIQWYVQVMRTSQEQ
jgi:hypothetical protein